MCKNTFHSISFTFRIKETDITYKSKRLYIRTDILFKMGQTPSKTKKNDTSHQIN